MPSFLVIWLPETSLYETQWPITFNELSALLWNSWCSIMASPGVMGVCIWWNYAVISWQIIFPWRFLICVDSCMCISIHIPVHSHTDYWVHNPDMNKKYVPCSHEGHGLALPLHGFPQYYVICKFQTLLDGISNVLYHSLYLYLSLVYSMKEFEIWHQHFLFGNSGTLDACPASAQFLQWWVDTFSSFRCFHLAVATFLSELSQTASMILGIQSKKIPDMIGFKAELSAAACSTVLASAGGDWGKALWSLPLMKKSLWALK